jgi:hypothetical protein
MQSLQTYYLSSMNNFTGTINKTKSAYMPPQQKRINSNNNAMPTPSPWSKTTSFSTEKKQLKKEFALTANAFPTLGETIPKGKGMIMSFSAAAGKKTATAPAAEKKSEVLPGWVHIRRNDGKIQYKYGPVVDNPNRRSEEESDIILGNILARYQIEREQYERDMDVERLGDLSYYYNASTLSEMYDQVSEMYKRENANNTNNANNSYNSDYEYNNYSD